MLTAIHLRALADTGRGTFIKLGLRRAQAISVVNVAVVLDFAGLSGDGNGSGPGSAVVTSARITLGSVAPTIVRAREAEACLTGRPLSETSIFEAAELAAAAAQPIDDIRGSAEYRRSMAGVLTERALQQLRSGREREGWPARPVLLETGPEIAESKGQIAEGRAQFGNRKSQIANHSSGSPVAPVTDHRSPITLTLNGRHVTLQGAAGKTLLRALRENAHMTGVKEGCAEGECGACTVWLDGQAVMSCLVPAARAQGCQVVTVEGLARDDQLHPLQAAFIAEGGVQCGYCTPGLLMSGAKLLQEMPEPTLGDIQQALAGNLCRCTGYAKVVAAIQAAAAVEAGGAGDAAR
jgi:carbon-monoxide dehydrogenase medium subunit